MVFLSSALTNSVHSQSEAKVQPVVMERQHSQQSFDHPSKGATTAFLSALDTGLLGLTRIMNKVSEERLSEDQPCVE